MECYFIDKKNSESSEIQFQKQALRDWKELFVDDIWPEMYQCGSFRSRSQLLKIAKEVIDRELKDEMEEVAKMREEAGL